LLFERNMEVPMKGMAMNSVKLASTFILIAPLFYACAAHEGRPDSSYASARPPHAHWGWINGRDASTGSGWIDDTTGQPIAMGRMDQRNGPAGYHWGWLNGRDASGGEGWISDTTGQPLDPRDPRWANRR